MPWAATESATRCNSSSSSRPSHAGERRPALVGIALPLLLLDVVLALGSPGAEAVAAPDRRVSL